MAQPNKANLAVATRLVTPFVFEEKGKLTGFSVKLWQEIAKQLNAKSTFVLKPTVKELLSSVKSQETQLRPKISPILASKLFSTPHSTAKIA